jgi:hypothetical protein
VKLGGLVGSFFGAYGHDETPRTRARLRGTFERDDSSRVVKKGSVVSVLRVLTKQGGDDEKNGGVSAEIR